jgi:hypothetical protein
MTPVEINVLTRTDVDAGLEQLEAAHKMTTAQFLQNAATACVPEEVAAEWFFLSEMKERFRCQDSVVMSSYLQQVETDEPQPIKIDSMLGLAA